MLKAYFVERWKGRPVSAIDRQDVLGVINEAVDRGAPYQAHNLLGSIRSFFNWAIATGDYGLEHSPCDRIRPKVAIGERKPRQRVLDDAELRALWKATGRMGYPFGPLYQLLLLTGSRKSEIGEAQRSEPTMKSGCSPSRPSASSQTLSTLSLCQARLGRSLRRCRPSTRANIFLARHSGRSR